MSIFTSTNLTDKIHFKSIKQCIKLLFPKVSCQESNKIILLKLTFDVQQSYNNRQTFPLPSPLMKPGYFCVCVVLFCFVFKKHKLGLNNHGIKAVDLFSLSQRMVSNLLKQRKTLLSCLQLAFQVFCLPVPSLLSSLCTLHAPATLLLLLNPPSS